MKNLHKELPMLGYFEGLGSNSFLKSRYVAPSTQGKTSVFFHYLNILSALNREDKMTIHCKTESDVELVKHLSARKDAYVLRAFNSYTIFLKGGK